MPFKDYPMPPEKPEFVLREGYDKNMPRVTYDFNDGCRVMIHPMEDAEKTPTFSVVMTDLDRGHVLFADSGIRPGTMLVSKKKYYIRWGLEVRDDETGRLAGRAELDLFAHDTLVMFPVGTLGDSIAWLSATWEFAQNCNGARTYSRLFVVVNPTIKELYDDAMFGDVHPLHLLTPDELEKMRDAGKIKPYATYAVGLFIGDDDCDTRPFEYQKLGLIDVARSILGTWPRNDAAGLEPLPPPKPKDYTDYEYALPSGPYAAIAVQASMPFKSWLNAYGWMNVVQHLKDLGLGAVCVDREPATQSGPVCVSIPHGAEDYTGDWGLQNRAATIKGAEMFIGCSSGLAWLAWACRVPAIVIGGFTEPFNEAPEMVRVYNPHVCRGCWNDTRFKFDVSDPLWCPRHRNDKRHLECSTCISAESVIRAIDRIHGIAQAVTPEAKP